MKAKALRMSDVARGMTLQIDVTGLRVFRFRLWLGMLLMMLAGRVIGCGVEINDRTVE